MVTDAILCYSAAICFEGAAWAVSCLDTPEGMDGSSNIGDGATMSEEETLKRRVEQRHRKTSRVRYDFSFADSDTCTSN
jgi:hypothetical protein